MMLRKLAIAATILTAASALTACAFEDGSESDGDEHVGMAFQGVGGTGLNNVAPIAIDVRPLRRSITDSFNLTSSTNPDVLPLCKPGTVTSTGCTMAPEWESWLTADSVRAWMMKGLAKCAVEPGFFIKSSDGSISFPGQWALYQSWKDNRLDGQDKRERISACVLTLLNGNNQSLNICIIGPGGSPFSDACADPSIVNREAGFFGDLFSATPTAYVAGPDASKVSVTGRMCYANTGTYCCDELDNTCMHHIVRAGSLLGSATNNYADKRCKGFATSGSYTYCTSFYSDNEPGRVYNNVFTTFVPAAL
jgi:hypothetical protein